MPTLDQLSEVMLSPVTHNTPTPADQPDQPPDQQQQPAPPRQDGSVPSTPATPAGSLQSPPWLLATRSRSRGSSAFNDMAEGAPVARTRTQTGYAPLLEDIPDGPSRRESEVSVMPGDDDSSNGGAGSEPLLGTVSSSGEGVPAPAVPTPAGDPVIIRMPPPPCMVLAPERRVHLTFSNVGKRVTLEKTIASAAVTRDILQGVTGEVKPGEVMAVMGPSGGGKSTFLDILSGRSRTSRLEGVRVRGVVRWNGAPLASYHMREVGYVTQKDIFWEVQTVYQAVSFVAALQLPKTVSVEEREAAVQYVMEALYLTASQHTMLYLLSGGERKRVAIAIELLNNPALLVLDEPSSGLDSAASYALMLTLCELAAQGRTIVCAIHQPSSRLFDRFDQLLLVARGHSIYCAPPSHCTEYFASLGHPCPPGHAVAEHIVDLLQLDYAVRDYLIDTHAKLFPRPTAEEEEVADRLLVIERKSERAAIRAAATVLSDAGPSASPMMVVNSPEDQFDIDGYAPLNSRPSFRASFMLRQSLLPMSGSMADIEDLSPPKSDDEGEEEDPEVAKMAEIVAGFQPTGTFVSSFFTQVRELYVRFNRGYVRYVIFAPLNVLQWFIMTALISLCWLRLGITEDNLTDRDGFAFFTLSYWSLNAMYEAQAVLPLERAGLNKDRAAGMYRTSSYVVAKFLAETPGKLMLPIAYMLIAFYCTNVYDTSPKALFGWIATLCLSCLAGEAMGLFIGSLVTSIQKSLVLTTVSSLGLMIVGGFYVKNLPYYFEWTKWLSFIKYGFSALLLFEYQPERLFVCQYGQWAYVVCGDYYPDYTDHYGEKILTGEDLRGLLELKMSIVENWLVLLGWILLFRFGAYLGLRFLHTNSTTRRA